jgi:adenylosuccinate synthase
VGSGPFPTELFDEIGETMGRVGHEFGATTGRSRRCGWLDLVALRYAVEINGVTQLMMMKGDVLSGFDVLKVCTGYTYRGETIEHLPYSLNPDELSPIYTSFSGWKEDLTVMREASELPQSLQDYIAFIEDFVQVPISIVSVGPDRSQTIFRTTE